MLKTDNPYIKGRKKSTNTSKFVILTNLGIKSNRFRKFPKISKNKIIYDKFK